MVFQRARRGRLGIGESTATAWVGRWRRTGSAEAKKNAGDVLSMLKDYANTTGDPPK